MVRNILVGFQSIRKSGFSSMRFYAPPSHLTRPLINAAGLPIRCLVLELVVGENVSFEARAVTSSRSRSNRKTNCSHEHLVVASRNTLLVPGHPGHGGRAARSPARLRARHRRGVFRRIPGLTRTEAVRPSPATALRSQAPDQTRKDKQHGLFFWAGVPAG